MPLALPTTDTGQAKLDKLDAVLALASTSKQDAALFADLLSLPNDVRYPTLEFDTAGAPAKNAGGAWLAVGGVVPLSVRC